MDYDGVRLDLIAMNPEERVRYFWEMISPALPFLGPSPGTRLHIKSMTKQIVACERGNLARKCTGDECQAILTRTNIILFGSNATYVWYADHMFGDGQDRYSLGMKLLRLCVFVFCLA